MIHETSNARRDAVVMIRTSRVNKAFVSKLAENLNKDVTELVDEMFEEVRKHAIVRLPKNIAAKAAHAATQIAARMKPVVRTRGTTTQTTTTRTTPLTKKAGATRIAKPRRKPTTTAKKKVGYIGVSTTAKRR